MADSLIQSFTARPASAAAADIWARLEQEAIPAGAGRANLADLYQMLAMAMSGQSAYEYIYDSCPYVTIIDGLVRVTLAFYVWPSEIDLNYRLHANIGEIGLPELVEAPKSFDAVFDNTDSVELGYLFTGSAVPEMPFFNQQGELLPDPAITILDTLVMLPENVTTVLRLDGLATGYKHTITMELVKAQDGEPYSIDNLKATVTCIWTDEDGQAQTDILDLQIPGCVEDLLNLCDDGRLRTDVHVDEDQLYVVYYSTCNGEILRERWEDRKR